MGFNDISLYNGGAADGTVMTPHIDALAEQGVTFTNGYSANAVCAPSRATLMTGLHPHQTGIGHMTQPPNKLNGAGKPPAYQGHLHRQCVTVAEVLKEHGYATLMAGQRSWSL